MRIAGQLFPGGTDLHTLRAMEMYGVKKDKVTAEMRKAAKLDNYKKWYTP